MTQDLGEFETISPRRPTFLTVLCILTFIGSCYGIVTGTITYFNADKVAATMTEANTEMNKDLNKKSKTDPEEKGLAVKVMSNMSLMTDSGNIRESSLGSAIASVFCLLGAILMWRLNRKGFYIYILGTIIGIAVPFYVYGNNFLTGLTVAFTAFIGVLFIIFYAMNLKSMK